MRNVWVIPETPKVEKWAGGHPNQKPWELLRRIILSCSKKGDIVFDPFVGSGTTVFVANDMGRKILGFANCSGYFGLARGYFNRSTKHLYSIDNQRLSNSAFSAGWR